MRTVCPRRILDKRHKVEEGRGEIRDLRKCGTVCPRRIIDKQKEIKMDCRDVYSRTEGKLEENTDKEQPVKREKFGEETTLHFSYCPLF